MKLRYMVSIWALVAIAAFAYGIYVNTWRDLVADLGGVPTLADEAQRPCYWFKKDQQLQCFSEFTTWYGTTDAVPVYVIDHGNYVAIFNDKRWN